MASKGLQALRSTRALPSVLLDLTSADHATRQNAGKELLSLRTVLVLTDGNARKKRDNRFDSAWTRAVSEVFASPAFPGADVGKKLVHYLVEAHTAYLARINEKELSFANEEATSMAAIMAAGVVECVGPGAVNVVPELIDMLTAHDGSQAHVAASALRSIGTGARAAVPALLDQIISKGLNEWPNRKGIALAAIAGDQTPEIVGKLIALLCDPRETARRGAAGALAEFGAGAGDAIAGLVEGTRHWDAEMRSVCFRALKAIGKPTPEIFNAILDGTQSDEWWVRGNAIDTLSGLYPQSDASIKILIAALDDPGGDGDWNVRDVAADGIARVGPKALSAVPTLLRFLQDEDNLVNLRMVAALAAIGPGAADAIPHLRELMNGSVQDVHEQIEHAINAIQSPASGETVTI
jgi:HEAT repeat protein